MTPNRSDVFYHLGTDQYVRWRVDRLSQTHEGTGSIIFNHVPDTTFRSIPLTHLEIAVS